jgi:hypothetical protein
MARERPAFLWSATIVPLTWFAPTGERVVVRLHGADVSAQSDDS